MEGFGGTPYGVGGRERGLLLPVEPTTACEGLDLGLTIKLSIFSTHAIYLSCPKVSNLVKENAYNLGYHH